MATCPIQPAPSIVDLDIAGMHPFWSAPDAVDECLAEAHALLMFMSDAFELSEGFGEETRERGGFLYDNSIRTMREGLKGQALRGVARLIATAQHCADVAAYQRKLAA